MESGEPANLHTHQQERGHEDLGKYTKLRDKGIQGAAVEVILAHDYKWFSDNAAAAWPGFIS